MTRPRYILPILVLAALTSPVAALDVPRGYVPAILSGQAPEGSHTMEAYAKRQDCGRSITVLVERGGAFLPATARITCR